MGRFISFVIVVIVIKWLCSGPDPQRPDPDPDPVAGGSSILEEEKARQLENVITLRLIKEEIAKGCNSQAVFKKIWLLGWALSAPNAGAIAVDDLYPQDKNKIKRAIEKIGAGDPVPYADFLRYAGLCR